MLKHILKEQYRKMWTGFSWGAVEGFCDNSNELSGSIKGWKYLD